MRYGNPSKKTKTIASLKGHSVEFPGKGSVAKKDAPAADPKFPERAMLVDDAGVVFVYVPPQIAGEVAAAGMLPETEIEEQDAPRGAVKPEDPVKLQAAVFSAFEMLVQANERESFAGNGVPKPAALAGLLGYGLTNTELKEAWGKYLTEAKDKG